MKASNTSRRMSSSAFSRLKALRAFKRDRTSQAYPHSVTSLLRRTSSSPIAKSRLLKGIKDTTSNTNKCTSSSNNSANSSVSSTNVESCSSGIPQVDSSHPEEVHNSSSNATGIQKKVALIPGFLEGRRTSGRQRKPSCRLTFDGSQNTEKDKKRHKNSLSRSSSCGSSASSGGDHHSGDIIRIPKENSFIASRIEGNKIRVSRVEETPRIEINAEDDSLQSLPPPPVVKIEPCSVVLQKNIEMPVLTRMMAKGQSLAEDRRNEKEKISRTIEQLQLLNDDVSSCYCRKNEQVFADSRLSCDEDCAENQSRNHIYCQATDLIDGSLIGCTRISTNNLQLRRVSARGIFMLMCKYHERRLHMHHCCPLCDSFCTQGEDIIICEAQAAHNANNHNNGFENGSKMHSKEYHFFHKSCAIQDIQNSFEEANAGICSELIEIIWNRISCPHCGAKGRGSLREIILEMSGSRPPIYMDEKPEALMDISLATFTSTKVSKETTIKFLTENFSPAIQAACDTARSTVKRSLSTMNAKNAIEQINLSEFISYLAHDGDPFHIYEDCNGESLAHIVVRSGDLSFLHVLYTCIEEQSKGDHFPLDIPDLEGVTPLFLGVQLNHMNIVKYLLACGANYQLKTPKGLSILHVAVIGGQSQMVETLLSFVDNKILQSRNNEGLTALGIAAKEGKSEIINILTPVYSSLNLVNDTDSLLRTPLHWAAQNAQVESVVILIKSGAHINAKDIDGNTPLHLAVLSDSGKSEGNALALLINRSNPFVTNNEGHTVVDYCRDFDSYDLVKRKKNESILQVIESNESIKQLQLTSSTSNLRVLHRDISKGKEKYFTIPCVGPTAVQKEVNSVISNFTYITTFVSENPTLRPDLNITSTHRCSCDSSSCSISSYNCCIRGDGLHYVNEKLLIPEGMEKANLIVYECNDFCSCEVKTCTNRVIQKGLRQNLEVFVKDLPNNVISFGVRTSRFIERGSFVCELIGELVLSSDINLRLFNKSSDEGKKQYESNIFELYESEEKFKILVDCQRYGNICKFMRMSSNAPNLIPVKIFVEHSDPRFPRVALFANKDISPGEELTYGC